MTKTHSHSIIIETVIFDQCNEDPSNPKRKKLATITNEAAYTTDGEIDKDHQNIVGKTMRETFGNTNRFAKYVEAWIKKSVEIVTEKVSDVTGCSVGCKMSSEE